MKLPKNSKKVYSGEIFDVYQWKQKNFNGDMWTFERITRRDTVVILAVFQGKIVICKQQQPASSRRYYSCLSGRLEIGESPRSAAKRELLEEAGLSCKQFVHRKTYDEYDKIIRPIHIYIAKDCYITKKVALDGGEKIKLLPLSFEEFIAIIEQGKIPASMFLANDILRMDKAGKLKEFKKELGLG